MIYCFSGGIVMNKFFFSVSDEYRGKLSYGFAGVGCHYEQEHVKRPGGREETEWIYPFYQWIQCRRGSGELWLDGKKYTVSEGQGMLLFPNEPHEYMAAGSSWEVDWVIFEGRSVGEFIRGVMKAECSGVYSVTSPHIVSELIVRLYDTAVSENPMKYILASGIVYEILLNIYVYAFNKQSSSLANKADRLMPVFNYINNHYKEPILLETLANTITVTPQHLCHIFKSFTGRTVTEYINSVRIGKSKELLLSGRNLLIKEIAAECGFTDVSYFCETFRRSEGISPAVFRERG